MDFDRSAKITGENGRRTDDGVKIENASTGGGVIVIVIVIVIEQRMTDKEIMRMILNQE